MRPLLRAVALAVILFMLLSCGVSPQQPPQAAPATPTASAAATPEQPPPCARIVPPLDTQFPPNFDYPQTADTIKSWRNGRSGHLMRNHAYCLFAGLNLPVMGVPAWRRFKTSTQAFPYQYNPWIEHAPDGKPLESSETSHPATINESRSEARGRLGDIRNPPPIYVINDALADDPRYRQCRKPRYDKEGKFLGYILRDGEMFQSNGDIMIAVVSYNEAALKYIQNAGPNTNLYDAAKLDARLPQEAGDDPTTIGDFPSGSIVLKVMYWPVAVDEHPVTALPVWDWDANKPGSPTSDGRYAGYEMQKFWTKAVAISSVPTTAKTADVTFLHGVLDDQENQLGPNTYPGAPIVGLDRFYTKNFSESEFDSLSPCDQALLHASAYWTYNREFRPGDSLAMIAMHIMTKEQPDWTFQSAWWHPDAFPDCHPLSTNFHRFCNDQPTFTPSADESWRNYMMVTTYGTLQFKPGGRGKNFYAPDNTKDLTKTWPVAYNPYIELAASHPITTNCMNCHHRAAWPPDVPDQKPDRGRFSAYLQATPANPNVLESFTTDDGPFKGLLMLDSMWGVSDRAGYRPVTSPAKAP